MRCGGPVGSDPPPPMEPPYQGSAGPPLRSALGRRPSFLRSQPRLPAWHLASHLGASPATRVEGVNWPWPPSSGLGRLSSANCGAKGSSPLGRHPHPTSSPRPSPDPPPPDQPGPRPLAASPSHQALLACVAPRPHQPHTSPRAPSPHGAARETPPNSHQELLEAEPSTERGSLPTPGHVPPTDLEVKAQGTWGEEALVVRKSKCLGWG